MTTEEPVYCNEEIRPGTLEDPPEFCENEAIEDSEFCELHDPDVLDSLLEDRAEARREAAAWVEF